MQEQNTNSPRPSSTLPSKEQLAILLTFQYSPGDTVFDVANRHDTLSPRSETRAGWEIFRQAVKDKTPVGIALAQTGFFDPEIATILSVVQEVEQASQAAIQYLRIVVHRTGSSPLW